MKLKRDYKKPASRVVGSFKPRLLSGSPPPEERLKPEQEDDGLNIFDEGQQLWKDPWTDAL